ncbi:MAG: helix-turn-helix domain-containing protein [Pyrinomonadaceae bacterium]
MMMQETVTPNKWAYSIKEIAQQTSLSQPFVRLEIKRGKLKARKFGTRTLITAENLSNYLNGGNDEQK